mmetsp:Transcript_22999/g.32117  ORF Transcript_22999/g.32117 Transcript_22999/m.32117 type:complete len:165 (+) Transcript_22999:355-849(+)
MKQHALDQKKKCFFLEIGGTQFDPCCLKFGANLVLVDPTDGKHKKYDHQQPKFLCTAAPSSGWIHMWSFSEQPKSTPARTIKCLGLCDFSARFTTFEIAQTISTDLAGFPDHFVKTNESLNSNNKETSCVRHHRPKSAFWGPVWGCEPVHSRADIVLHNLFVPQ